MGRMADVVALVLAGGRGSRLAPLTDHRSKPAVPLAGSFSLIDATLSNLANSGLRTVWIAEQYRPGELNRHLAGGRPWDLDGTREGLRVLPPRQGGEGDGFTAGNGQAIYQNLQDLEAVGARDVVVVSADHLYQLDFDPVLQQHAELGSDVTVVTTEVQEDPSRYGVVQLDGDRVVEYAYKPSDPTGSRVATEAFVFTVAALREACDALVGPGSDGEELADYGDTILPHMVAHGRVHSFDLRGYWRDLGTIDAYFQAHMELIDGRGIDLFDPAWPLMTNLAGAPPARVRPGAITTSLGHEKRRAARAGAAGGAGRRLAAVPRRGRGGRGVALADRPGRAGGARGRGQPLRAQRRRGGAGRCAPGIGDRRPRRPDSRRAHRRDEARAGQHHRAGAVTVSVAEGR